MRSSLQLGSLDSKELLDLSCNATNTRLDVLFTFRRERLIGVPSETIQTMASSLVTFGDRLKTEVLGSKVRLSHDIRTAISQTSRVYASHASVGVRGA